MGIQYKLLAVLVLVLLSGGGTGVFVHRYDAGQEAERNLANAKQYADAIAKATEQRLAQEQAARDALSASQARFQQQLKETTDHANATIADLRNGIIRLRVATDGAAGTDGVPKGAGPDSGSAQASTCYASAGFSEAVGRTLADFDALQVAYNIAYERLQAIRTDQQ